MAGSPPIFKSPDEERSACDSYQAFKSNNQGSDELWSQQRMIAWVTAYRYITKWKKRINQGLDPITAKRLKSSSTAMTNITPDHDEDHPTCDEDHESELQPHSVDSVAGLRADAAHVYRQALGRKAQVTPNQLRAASDVLKLTAGMDQEAAGRRASEFLEWTDAALTSLIDDMRAKALAKA